MRGNTSRVLKTHRDGDQTLEDASKQTGEKLMNENNRRGGKGVCYSRATEGHGHGNAST